MLQFLKQEQYDASYLYSLLIYSESSCMDNIPMSMIETTSILKTSHEDMDTPTLREALNGQ